MDLVLDTSRPATGERPFGPGSVGREPGEASSIALCDFIRKMRANPAAEFQTEDAAAAFGVTPFGFIRAFKKLTGLSPQRFRAALRIELAKRLLVDTDRSVTEISFDAGYNSLGTFVRTFTLLVGVAPGQLRRLSHGESGALDDLEAGLRAEWPLRSAAGICATIEYPVPGASILAAGLFPQALPTGLPFDGCFVDPANPVFRLAWPLGRRRLSLLAAAIREFSLRDAWAGRLEDVRVCSLGISAPLWPPNAAPLRLRLRPLEETDPPFLTPVPLLMMLRSRRED